MDFTEAVALAQQGKEEGFSFLYENTYTSKYYLALQYMKNEEKAKDVIQEAYVRAFSKISTLENPDSFSSWLGIIVANTAKNHLTKKNQSVLFSDLEQEGDSPLQLEDERMDHQPDLVFSQKETKELLQELINSLSDEQRMCILLYYIQEASIKEISQALECSENTVKSRLRYGKEKLKEKVEDLQKKGYAVYGVAPIPLLLSLFHAQESAFMQSKECVVIGKELGQAILSKSHGSVATSTSKLAGKSLMKHGFLHTMAGKATAVIIGLAVVGGASYGISKVWTSPAPVESEQQGVQKEKTTKNQEVKDSQYSSLIEGGLTKDELEFVLAYGPQEMQDGEMSQQERKEVLFTLCNSPEGLIQAVSTDTNGRNQYSLQDVNRYFSSFSEQLFSKDKPEDGIQIEEDTIALYPASTYQAQTEIQSANIGNDEMEILYSYEYTSSDGRTHYTANKKATLFPDGNGYYRIQTIEDVDEQPESAEQSTSIPASMVKEYSYVAPAGGVRSTMQIDTSGEVRIIESISASPETTTKLYQMQEDTTIQAPQGAIAYLLRSEDGSLTRCFFYYPEQDKFKEPLDFDPTTNTYTALPEDGFEWVASNEN